MVCPPSLRGGWPTHKPGSPIHDSFIVMGGVRSPPNTNPDKLDTQRIIKEEPEQNPPPQDCVSLSHQAHQVGKSSKISLIITMVYG